MILSKEIHHYYKNVEVNIDRYGSEKYQDSFNKYLTKGLQEELFEPKINISSAKIEPFIQISDIISGSLRKALNNEFDDNDLIFDTLNPIWKLRKKYPNENQSYLELELDESEFLDCVEIAERYLEKEKNNSDIKYEILQYLYLSIIENRSQYIYKDEILEWLKYININVNDEQFRYEIAKLRDENVIISSSVTIENSFSKSKSFLTSLKSMILVSKLICWKENLSNLKFLPSILEDFLIFWIAFPIKLLPVLPLGFSEIFSSFRTIALASVGFL